MNKAFLIIIAAAALANTLFPAGALADPHSIGIGAHYFYTFDEIEDQDDFDREGVGYNVSYRYRPVALIAFQGEVQFFPNDFLDADRAYSVKGFVIVGSTIYAALGVGSTYVEYPSGDKDWQDAEYQLRAGLDLFLIPEALSLDVNANYILARWDDVGELDDEFDEDALQFGVALRFHF